MSFAAVNNIQYRLTPVDGGTLITFKHSALGLIPDEHRTGVQTGWAHMLDCVRRVAEKGDKKRS
jgi:hypothetical protein